MSTRRSRFAISISISPRPGWNEFAPLVLPLHRPRSRMACAITFRTFSPVQILIAKFLIADACHPVPRFQSDRRRYRTVRHPLVRPRLYRRAADRLALLPLAGEASARRRLAGGDRRFPRLGDARRRARRPPRLCAVLQAELLSRESERDHRAVAWRHVLPWRRARRADRAALVLPPARPVAARFRRHHHRRRADRDFLRPRREFRERRALGPADGCALGRDLSQCRRGVAPSERAL